MWPHVQLVIGPMFSGKTTHLKVACSRSRAIERKVLLIKHSIDDRYGDPELVLTHSKDEVSADKVVMSSSILEVVEREKDGGGWDLVLIDEGQFFGDLREGILRLGEVGAKEVVVSALNGSARQLPFESVSNVIPLASEIVTLTALCKCGKEAHFSAKIGGDLSSMVEVGGKDKYEAMCKHCLVKEEEG